VCVPRNSCAKQSDSWGGFAFPPGVRYLRNQSCRAAPHELGIDNAWLPVTHCYTQRPAVGFWFYYMRGCSDSAWNVGRTKLVINRCDAALVLQQRLAHNASGHIGRSEAARRVAIHMRANHGNGTAVWTALQEAASRVSVWAGRKVTFAEALEGCAAGLYDSGTDECQEALAEEPDVSRTRRARAYAYLAGHNLLDFHNMAIAQRLRGTPFELDTMQLWQQPQGGGGITWTTEVWDVRALSRRNAFFSPRVGALDGSQCKMQIVQCGSGMQCRACNGSKMAMNCRKVDKSTADATTLECDSDKALY
tara:strand:+ start:175 stop:1092 length:918 start_codon:yes stop_codon:yes gene_type:complete